MVPRIDALKSSRFVRAALIANILLIAALIILIELPPVQDYPNHLARYWLLAGGQNVAPTSGMFAIDWRYASTNIGADLLVAILVSVVHYWAAGKLVLVACFVGPPAAAAWLNRILFDRWSWWSLSFLLLAFTTMSVLGFMNYQLSLAVALLFACLDTLIRSPPVLKFAARVVFAAATLVVHRFGLVFFLLLLLALTIGPEWIGLADRRRLLTIANRGVSVVLAGVVPVALLQLLSPNPPGDHHVSTQAFIVRGLLSPAHLFLTAASPFLTYRAWSDLLFFAPLLAIYVFALVKQEARTHAGMLTLGLVTAAVSLVMPTKVGDATLLDRRLPLMAAYLLFAGAQPQPFKTRSGERAAAAGMFGIVAARTLWIGSIWLARERDVWSVETVLKNVPAGAAVFAVQSEPSDFATRPIGRFLAAQPAFRSENTLLHVPVMAIPWRKAFVPTLFAVPGQQPVRVIPPWTDLKSFNAEVPDVHVLDSPPPAELLREMPYLRLWPDRFDYVIAIGMDRDDYQGPFRPPRQLSLVADEGYDRLYRVER